MPRIVFVLPGGERRVAEVSDGTSVLDAARLNDIDIEGACGGSMACATCHVQVEEDWFDRLPPASAEEEDMLDLAADWRPTSRLGCQLRVDALADGLVVKVPRSSLLV